ncbi:9083_t:CDS:1 [Dentiscutata erythropus]|uniref:9083_t:CDS:1 n=1 Tax=Dentiscutata erythropus TaxID=1348616 RepID=A0A9N9BVT9_9GLOM|nr:9083_t:CDS:1 [Dentiscutata erythropus]
MWSLLLVILFNCLQVKGGLQFNNCVGSVNYQGIINYNAKNNLTANNTYACYNGQCSTFPIAHAFSMVDITFQCVSLNQSAFCITTGSSLTDAFGGLCGGILGDTPATNFQELTNVDCPSLNAVSNTLLNGPTTDSAFTWLCCNSVFNNCTALNNVTVNNGWATTNCGHGNIYNSLMCFADNGGWVCAGGNDFAVAVKKVIVTSIYIGFSAFTYKCIFQLGGIGLSNNLLLNSKSVSCISNSNCEDNYYKLLDTAIPLAALLFLAIILVFYYWQQCKKASESSERDDYSSQTIDSDI